MAVDTFTTPPPQLDGWQLVSARDNWMYRRGELVFKTARPGHEHRVLNGLRSAAAICDQSGGDQIVLRPHTRHVATVNAAVTGSLWPWCRTDTTPGEAVAAYQTLNSSALGDFGALPFDPLPKIEDRLRLHNDRRWRPLLPWLDRLGAQVDAARKLPTRSQHGDASFENTVRHPTGAGVAIIDFDSAGQHPVGWDRACLHFSSLFNDQPLFDDVWPIDDASRLLLPIKWALSLSWHLAQGATPPVIGLGGSFDWAA